jgi:hypothetical protein
MSSVEMREVHHPSVKLHVAYNLCLSTIRSSSCRPFMHVLKCLCSVEVVELPQWCSDFFVLLLDFDDQVLNLVKADVVVRLWVVTVGCQILTIMLDLFAAVSDFDESQCG